MGLGAGFLSAQSISVPNGSFESPTSPPGFPAFPQVDVWQKAPEVPGIPLPDGITWDQLAGVFPNTPAGTFNHIDNLDGNQAAYLLAIPGVGLQQTLNSTFEVGKAYSLTLGVLGGGGLQEGSRFEMSLYFLDDASSLVPVTTSVITYNSTAFPTITHLQEQQLSLGATQPTDVWAGRKIGIRLLSSFGTGVGYWDVDKVQLAVVPEPAAATLLALGVGGVLWLARASRREP